MVLFSFLILCRHPHFSKTIVASELSEINLFFITSYLFLHVTHFVFFKIIVREKTIMSGCVKRFHYVQVNSTTSVYNLVFDTGILYQPKTFVFIPRSYEKFPKILEASLTNCLILTEVIMNRWWKFCSDQFTVVQHIMLNFSKNNPNNIQKQAT